MQLENSPPPSYVGRRRQIGWGGEDMFISFPALLNCSMHCGFPMFYGFRGMFFTQIVWFYTLSMFFTAAKFQNVRPLKLQLSGSSTV